MAAALLSDELARQAADTYIAAGNKCTKASADSLKLPLATYKSRLKVAASRGMLLETPAAMPGYRIAQVTDGPAGKSVQQKPEHGDKTEIRPGFEVSRVTTLSDPDGGKIVEWVQQKPGKLDPLAIAETLKAAFQDYKPAAPLSEPPAACATKLLSLLPCNDWHVGLHIWGKQAGENWDLKIAEQVIGEAVEATVAKTDACGIGVVLVGGDMLHADNKNNQTARSGNVLDVDGRYQKILMVACRLLVRTVEANLRKHGRVIVRVLPGNHDEHAAVAIAYFLLAWFRNEPRVTVDVDPSLFWWFLFGACQFGAVHGHEAKAADMPAIMAHRRAEDWGAARFRYIHSFHLHHKKLIGDTVGGCIVEIHEAPIPMDSWHYGKGFLSGRSIQAITYHKEFGEVGRDRTAILDAVKPPTESAI